MPIRDIHCIVLFALFPHDILSVAAPRRGITRRAKADAENFDFGNFPSEEDDTDYY